MTSFDTSFDFVTENPGDLLYEDFCDSFLCRVDYQLLTPQPRRGKIFVTPETTEGDITKGDITKGDAADAAEAKDTDKTEGTEDFGVPPLSDVNFQGWTKSRIGRRDRLRAKICRFTRAIFRATNAQMPRKKSDPENFKSGCDYFLHFAYGDVFDRQSYWYYNPDPLDFFSLLCGNASGGRVELSQRQFDKMFYKMGDHKSCGWRLNEDFCREMGLRAEDLMREVRRVKTLRRADYIPRVATDPRFV